MVNLLREYGSTKLELGAGDRPTEGFIHNDVRELPHIEIVCPAEQIGRYISSQTLTHLRATHLLEHFSHRNTVWLLEQWRDLLQPGGLIYVEVPNLMWQAKALAGVAENMYGCSPEEVVVMMYGEQDYEGNFHKTGFTPQLLSGSLRTAGFVNVMVEDVGQVLIGQGRAVHARRS
jgi:predicted SAM-dependent methyltransferase